MTKTQLFLVPKTAGKNVPLFVKVRGCAKLVITIDSVDPHIQITNYLRGYEVWKRFSPSGELIDTRFERLK